MKYLLIPTLMMLLLQKYVKSEEQCGDRSITGAVGGAVTLPVGRTEVKSFVWSFVGKDGSIAITSPGGSTSILQEQYEGRLSRTSDGSLIITRLKQEDQGTYLAQISKQKCLYHLTVFSNLTAEDVTISSNGTNNETCEGSFTCSVNGSNVTVTWRNVNSSDINQTENVVFVPPRNVNFTYICTAQNPVSEVSKTVHPWEYCQKKETDSHHSEQRIVFGYAAVPFVVFIIIVVLCVWNYCRKRKIIAEGEDLNTHAGTQTPNVKQPIPSRVKGTAGMDKNPHTMELQENQSNETTDKSLYSTVLHVKDPQESQSNFTTSNTVYSTVLQPKDKSYQQAPLESCYAQVKLPKPTEL